MNYRKYEDGINFYKGRMESKIDDHKDYVDLGEFYYLDGQHDKARKTWKMGMKKFINTRIVGYMIVRSFVKLKIFHLKYLTFIDNVIKS